MKKIIAMLLVIMSVLALGACGGTPAATYETATEPANPEKISYKDYDYSLEGLCSYLDDLGYFVYDYNASADEAGKSTRKMEAELIGAEKGYQSTYTFDKEKWIVEVYYYSESTSDEYKEALTGTYTYDNVEDGSFEITVNNEFAIVVIAPDGKGEHKDAIIKAFKDFYPNGR